MVLHISVGCNRGDSQILVHSIEMFLKRRNSQNDRILARKRHKELHQQLKFRRCICNQLRNPKIFWLPQLQMLDPVEVGTMIDLKRLSSCGLVLYVNFPTLCCFLISQC